MDKGNGDFEEYFLQNKWKAPVCNHFDADLNGNELMYAQGITVDGIPFEAELWKVEKSKCVTFVLPVIEYLEDENEDEKESSDEQNVVDEKTFASHIKKESQYITVLKQGMVMCDEIPSYQVMMNYVDYLVSCGLVSLENNMCNGGGEYSIDCEGNRVVSIIICLNEDGETNAKCPLEFREFPKEGYKKNATIKRIK